VQRACIARDLKLIGAAVTPAVERQLAVVIDAGGDNAGV